jgi:hypothetical protein
LPPNTVTSDEGTADSDSAVTNWPSSLSESSRPEVTGRHGFLQRTFMWNVNCSPAQPGEGYQSV